MSRHKELPEPVCIRFIAGINNYDPATDSFFDPPEPVCRIDVLVQCADGFRQKNITLNCERRVPEPGSKVGTQLWLHEPKGMNKGGTDGMRAISMLVDRAELVKKLRALATEIESLV